ncbi:MAG: hypothetical protein RL141_142 [Candidatus Parcubacteria bacterium]|jgi:O-antigen/teichoic acid export membrane protein
MSDAHTEVDASVARSLASNTAVQAAGKALSIVMGVVVVGLLTRLLGQEGFGKYSTANAFIQVFALFMDLGLNVMLVQMLGEQMGNEKEERRIVSALFTLRVIMAGVVISAAPFIGLLVPAYDHELKIALFAIWGSFFFTLLNQVVIGVHQRHLTMHVVAIGELVGRAVLLGGVVLAVAQGWGLIPVVLIVSLGGFVNFVVNFLLALRLSDFRWNIDVALWKTALRRSWPIGLSILFGLIYFKADTLVLSWVRSQSEVGIYGAAYRVLEILISLPFMYAGVLLPIIAKLWKDGAHARFTALIQRSFDAMALCVFPMVLGTQAIAVHAITLVAGPEFAPSGDVLRVLIIATGAIFLATVLSHAVVALDAQRDMLPWYIWTAIATLIAYIMLIPPYGIWAAAWLTVASEIVILIGNMVVVSRRTERALSWMIARKALAASLLMLMVTWMLVPISWILAVIAGAVVYVGFLMIMKAVTPEMLRMLLPVRKE